MELSPYPLYSQKDLPSPLFLFSFLFYTEDLILDVDEDSENKCTSLQ